MVNDFFGPRIEELDLADICLQQEGTTSSTSSETIVLLRSMFENGIISRSAVVIWPPKSCDLMQLDFLCEVPLGIDVIPTDQQLFMTLKKTSSTPFVR